MSLLGKKKGGKKPQTNNKTTKTQKKSQDPLVIGMSCSMGKEKLHKKGKSESSTESLIAEYKSYYK